MIWPRLSITVFLLSYCVIASLLNVRWWYGNIYPFVIGYAFRPHLSPRLTLGGQALPRKPKTFDGKVSHFALATHAGILS